MRQRVPLLRDLPVEVAVLASIAFFVALGFGIVIPSIPIFAASFGVSALAASAVVSAFALMRFVSSPLAGAWTNRFGERGVLATGLAIVAVSSFLAGLSQSYVQLLVLRGIGGIGSAMFTVSAMALLLRVVSADQRGRASAAWQGGFLIGGVSGPAIGGLVLAVSIRAPFFFYAGTLAIATIVAIVFLSPQRIARREQAVEAAGGEPADKISGWAELAQALRTRAYRAALAVNLASGLTAFGLRSALIPLFVVEGLRQGPSLSGWAFLVAAVVQAVLLLPAGRLTDLRGRRPAMIIGSVASVLGMGILVADDLATSSPSLALVVFFISMAVLGVATAFLGSAPSAVVGDIMGGRQGGSVVAAYQMVSDLGAVVGPLIGGLLLDLYGFDYAFAFGAAISAIALAFVLAMPETLRKSAQA
ncbi:MAG: MFS transporter [Actinomycetales bacterium]|nr:MFS transporter [Actinomycetales bacterium]